METPLKTDFAQIFSHCPKNLSCPKFGGAAAPLAPPARTPMSIKKTKKMNAIPLTSCEATFLQRFRDIFAKITLHRKCFSVTEYYRQKVDH